MATFFAAPAGVAFLLPLGATSLSIARRMLAYYLHNLDPFIFKIWDNVGPRWYGMAYVLAFICGFALLSRLSKRGYLDLPQSAVGDFITWTALFGVMVGGRLGYVIFYRPEMLSEPLSILRVWEGGMSSHGGMLGVVLFSLYYARRHKISWTNLGDNLVVAVPIGLFLGRCANFINGELYGRIASVPWAIQFPKELLERDKDGVLINADAVSRAVVECGKFDPTLITPEAMVESARTNPQVADVLRGIVPPRHPSQLYEAFLEGVVLFAILWFIRTRVRTPNGFLTGLFMICYGILRIVVEYFREPDAALIGIFTRGQFFSFFVVVLGIGFIVAAKRRPAYPRKLAA